MARIKGRSQPTTDGKTKEKAKLTIKQEKNFRKKRIYKTLFFISLAVNVLLSLKLLF